MLFKMQRGKRTALKIAKTKTWPGCFCGRFSDQEMLLAINFGGKRYFTGKMEVIRTISFKIRAKIVYYVLLRRRVYTIARHFENRDG